MGHSQKCPSHGLHYGGGLHESSPSNVRTIDATKGWPSRIWTVGWKARQKVHMVRLVRVFSCRISNPYLAFADLQLKGDRSMNAVADVENFATMVDERPEEFRVSTAAYRGPQTFAAEMDRIFGKTWIYLCHESEVEKPGDFKSTQIGTRPVIVGKDRDGQVYAVLNACTHRGATLVREEKGNTRAFVCPYHGWSFRPSGELIGIPDEARYPKCFQKADKHLKRVPKIASYGGLFFGSFNEQVESLEDFLGGAKLHIDLWLKRTAGSRYRVATSHKYGFSGNWKFQSENVYDRYHPGFVHRSAFNTVRKFEGSFENRALDVAVRQQGYTRGYPEGHGTLEAGAPLESGGIDIAVRQEYNDKLKTMY